MTGLPGPVAGRGASPWRSPWVLVPSVVGLVVALVLVVAGNPQGLRFTVPLATVSAVLGVLVGGAALAVLLVRRALRRARAAGAAQAREAERAAHHRFLARLDHELKNPLTAIHAAAASVSATSTDGSTGAADAADAAGSPSGTAGTAGSIGTTGAGGTAATAGTAGPQRPADHDRLSPVAVIEAQAVRMGRLVGDLRKIAALDSQPIEQEPVDVELLAADVVAAVEEELAVVRPTGAPGHGTTPGGTAPGRRAGPGDAAAPGPSRDVVVLFPRVPWPLPPVRGDVDLLFVALYNVLSNAVKYSADGARIEVRGFEEEGAVVVEVADTGAGIPPEEVSLVWDELARGSNTRGIPGSGLGLATVHAIVRRHGGQVLLSSRLGHGTSVRLRLPTAR